MYTCNIFHCYDSYFYELLIQKVISNITIIHTEMILNLLAFSRCSLSIARYILPRGARCSTDYHNNSAGLLLLSSTLELDIRSLAPAPVTVLARTSLAVYRVPCCCRRCKLLWTASRALLACSAVPSLYMYLLQLFALSTSCTRCKYY